MDAAATSGGRRAISLGTAASALLHVALFAALLRLPATRFEPPETVAFELVEVEPKPPPPAPAPAPAAPEPPPVDPVAAPRARPSAARAPAARARRPPPSDPSPPGAPRRGPVKIGVSMSSTTTAGGIAATVGNSLHGELPRQAPDPMDVPSDRAAGGADSPATVHVLPKGGCRDIPRDEYPRDARERGVEGVVTLQLLVGRDGRVSDVKVVRDPAGFGAAAVRIARRHCRFEPARRDGEAVATWITVPMRFELR